MSHLLSQFWVFLNLITDVAGCHNFNHYQGSSWTNHCSLLPRILNEMKSPPWFSSISSWGVQSPHMGHLIKFTSPLQLICNIPTLKLFPNAIYSQFPAWLPSLSLWRGQIVIRMSAEFRPFFPPSAILRAAVNCREFSGIATSRLTTSIQAFVSSRHLSRPLC